MATYTNKTSNTATYFNKYGKGDTWTAGQLSITAGQVNLFMGNWTPPTVYTNKDVNNRTTTNQELSIGDGFVLDIGDGMSLLIQSEINLYTFVSKNTSDYTNKAYANIDRTTQEMLIDDTYELLIDDTFSLEIQSASSGNIYYNKPINN